MFSDFVSLVFPKMCAACDVSLLKHEDTLCSQCEYSLPKTNYHNIDDNPVAKLFYGRIKVHSASALYSFNISKYRSESAIQISLFCLYSIAMASVFV